MSNEFPISSDRILRDLLERVEKLENLAKVKSGAPVIKSSGPFSVDGGPELTSSGGELAVNGTPILQAMDNVVALSVSVGTGSDTIPTVGAAFNTTTLNNIVRSLADKINDVIAEQIASSHMNPP